MALVCVCQLFGYVFTGGSEATKTAVNVILAFYCQAEIFNVIRWWPSQTLIRSTCDACVFSRV